MVSILGVKGSRLKLNHNCPIFYTGLWCNGSTRGFEPLGRSSKLCCPISRSGGTGRRVRLRSACRKACRFESCLRD